MPDASHVHSHKVFFRRLSLLLLLTIEKGGYNKPLCREEPPVCEIAKSMWRTIRPECLLKACFDRPVSIGMSLSLSLF